MKLKVIDDFLKPDDYEVLQNDDGGLFVSMAVCSGVNTPDDGYYQFCHVFYAQFEPRSPFFYNLMPLINELEPVSIVRNGSI